MRTDRRRPGSIRIVKKDTDDPTTGPLLQLPPASKILARGIGLVDRARDLTIGRGKS
ncbi:hypothetical protein ACFV23_05180 [Streptomyces sp. NPDC059627]